MDLNRNTEIFDTTKVPVLKDQVIPVIDGGHTDVARHRYSLAEMEAASTTARSEKPKK